MKETNKGFTLMELLIVIGVLGILAAGLLAAIDPFEQLKKARDTNNRSAAIELLQSSQRYYATHGYLPWRKPAGADFTCPNSSNWDRLRPLVEDTSDPFDAIAVDADLAAGNEVFDCLDDTLGADGEIKSTFFDGLATSLYVTSGTKTRVAVCFAPEGRSNRTDTATKYQISGATNADYVVTDVSGTSTCPDQTLDTCLQCFE